MNSFKAIMVDLDGTLAHTAEANWFAYRDALAEAGVTITRERFLLGVQGRNWREFLPQMLSEASVAVNPADIARRKAELYRSALKHLPINRPLVALIEQWRQAMGIQTALVTSASSASVLELLKVHELSRHFDTVVTGDDVTRHKPGPEAYALAASRMNVRAGDCLVFEDAEVGVASAKAFGAQVIRVVFDGTSL